MVMKMDEEKNINVVMHDFKQGLVNLINDSGLPACIVYEVMNGLTLQINNQMQSELLSEKEGG